MANEQADRMTGASLDIAAENRSRLKELFPSVFTETVSDGGELVESVDFAKLQAELGTFTDVFENRRERYGMDWPGKKDALRLIQTPSHATLKPCRAESVNFDTTGHLFIEGDNLEVLKLLQKSYYGKIKMIYIDPPYNTGKEFIYPDNYTEDLQTYLEYAGLADSSGKKFSTNTANEGRFHTKWLNMMYPRLYLARNLLRDDGVIFISIDDNKVTNLRKLCDEVFGEENYINTICVKAKPSAGASGGGEDKRLKKNVEFLLLYAKNKSNEGCIDINQAFDETELSEHMDMMREANKSWKYTRVVTNLGIRKQVASTFDGDGNEIIIYKHDGYNFSPISDLVIEGEDEIDAYKRHFENVFRDTNAQSSIRTRVIETIGNEDGFFSIDYIPRSGRNKGKKAIVFYKGVNKDQIAWLHDIARTDGENIFIRGKTGTLWADFNWNNVSKEGDTVFPNGKKPIAFIQRMLQLATKPNDIIAGSASTAHAVLELNKLDGGHRNFIMVQLPEPCSKEKENEDSKEFRTIADIGKERIRRVINKLNAEQEGKLDLEGDADQDRGFRVLKLDQSNFKPWRPLAASASVAQIEQQLFAHVDHLEADATPEDLLFEILLKAGFAPTAQAEQRMLAGIPVFSIAEGALLICLAEGVSKELIDAVVAENPQQFICLDAAFGGNDQLKSNAVQTFKAHNLQKEKHNQIVFKTV